jgi:putative endonuclease
MSQSGEVIIFTVYILQSQATERYYCGHTADLELRLKQHNNPDYHGSLTTKRFAGPWVVVWTEPQPTRSDAMKRERQIKKRGIGRFLKGVQLVESR